MTYEMYTPSSSNKIHKNTINLAHEICVQILKMEVVMDEVMDRVVGTLQHNLLQSLKALFSW